MFFEKVKNTAKELLAIGAMLGVTWYVLYYQPGCSCGTVTLNSSTVVAKREREISVFDEYTGNSYKRKEIFIAGYGSCLYFDCNHDDVKIGDELRHVKIEIIPFIVDRCDAILCYQKQEKE